MRSHGPRRFRAQRDSSSPEILKLLRKIGVGWWDGGVLDGLVAVHHDPYIRAPSKNPAICQVQWSVNPMREYRVNGFLVPVEIKTADKLNQLSRYRDAQLEFFKWCDIHGLPYFRWSTEADVLLDLGRTRGS